MDHSPRRTSHRSAADPAPPAPSRFLALGVLAHVDAGKTSLTEALLVAGGALESLGRVDDGTTQTDTLDQERRRGITIRAAVASFWSDDVGVNLVDTPGHPDFIAEVDRSLAVLDGAVLVVSAVEGVQAQTAVLHRALRRVGVPTVVFVNKVDRRGADPDRVVAEIRDRLGTPLVPTVLDDPAAAEAATAVLAEHDDELLAQWLARGTVGSTALRGSLGRLTRAGLVHPVLRGSARTGEGVRDLIGVVTDLLVPAAAPDPDAPVSGQVFAVTHREGRRVCTVRLRAGTLRVRDRVPLGPDRSGVVTALSVFAPGGAEPREVAVAGEIAEVAGLGEVRVGDVLGQGRNGTGAPAFAPPALQTTVVAHDPAQTEALQRALAQLAEVDPLIRVRPDPQAGAVRIDVYGEVQREVIAATLEEEHGVLADFSVPVPACVERPAGRAGSVRRMGDADHHRGVTIGVTVAPAAPGSGVRVEVTADRLTLPLHVYGTVEGLRDALRQHLDDVLALGPQGWPVTDVVVTLVESDYPSGGPSAADVRHTFATVVAEALRRAGTVVCEPVDRFRLETPDEAVPGVLGLLARHRGVPTATTLHGSTTVVTGEIPSGEVDRVRRALPATAHGLAVLETVLDHYAPHPGGR